MVSRPQVIVSLLGVVALLFAAAPPQTSAADPAPPGCASSTNGVAVLITCATPGAYAWTVPAGVTSALFDVFGAQGGGNGGAGGEAQAYIALTPGQLLQLNTGGKGGPPYLYGYPDNGGFNGGGRGQDGGGGGASDVRVGPYGFSERLLVAGGGGGGGSASYHSSASYLGGNGGGASGTSGTGGSGWDGGGGGGGTGSGGGSGGTAGAPSCGTVAVTTVAGVAAAARAASPNAGPGAAAVVGARSGRPARRSTPA
jgi:hypothetical protein